MFRWPLRSWVLLSLWLTSCSAPLQRYDSEFLAMGTLVQLSILSDNPATAATLSAQIERTLLQQGIDWYPWTVDARGELKQLNAALAAGERKTISPQLAHLLQRALQLHRQSDGYFDPAVAPLTQAWGFTEANTAASEASPELLTRWRKNRPTLAALRIAGTSISSTRQDLQLDLGAIGKGHALQLALEQLRKLGCDNAMLNMGGQIGVVGQSMAAQLQATSIRDPRADSPLAGLKLAAGESIATSGDYQRFAQQDRRRVHHLLDPFTGMPVTHTQAVTVVSADATLADVASTALMAAGPDHWRRVARQLGIREVLRVDATGAIEVTAALYARLQWRPAAQQLHSIKRIDL